MEKQSLRDREIYFSLKCISSEEIRFAENASVSLRFVFPRENRSLYRIEQNRVYPIQ